MRHILTLLAILAFAFPVYAAEPTSADAAIADVVALPAATPAPTAADTNEPAVKEAPAEEELATWQTTLIFIIGLVGTWLTKLLATNSNKKAASYEAQAAKTGQDTKQIIVARAKAFLWRRVAAVQEENLPELAQAIVRKQVSGDMIKERLKSFGNKLKAEAIEYFDRQNIDLLAEFGEEQINSWIRSAVDDLSVFKKWPTAKVLLEGGAEAILAVGVNKAGDYYDKLREKVAEGGEKPTAGVAGVVAGKIDTAINADLQVA